MLDKIFGRVFESGNVDAGGFMICFISSIILGVIIAASYAYRTRHTKSFLITLALLPAVVCVVIIMVNGSVGTGVAVAGAFGLVRFRSAPGTAREICALFLCMGSGLIAGMGYIAYSAVFTLVMCLLFVVYDRIGGDRSGDTYKILNVTIPENLNYTEIFDDIFAKYTSSHELTRVKTTNLGSMFRLTYDVKLKRAENEKDMLDDIRCRNGNLEISVSTHAAEGYEL